MRFVNGIPIQARTLGNSYDIKPPQNLGYFGFRGRYYLSQSHVCNCGRIINDEVILAGCKMTLLDRLGRGEMSFAGSCWELMLEWIGEVSRRASGRPNHVCAQFQEASNLCQLLVF